MKPETIAIHAGYDGDPTTKAVAVPDLSDVAFEFDSAEHGAALFNLEVAGKHLHPDRQPHQHGTRKASGGAGRRSRWSERQFRDGCD